MDDQRAGAALRMLRLRRGWRQQDVAQRADCSRATVSRVERGHLSEMPVDLIRRVALALDARVSVDVRWRGADLARLLDQRHAALQDELARRLAHAPGWRFVAEASFSIRGERGSVDLLAWHEDRTALLVVELKSELVDLQDLLATVDRKRRLAPVIARERGWRPGVGRPGVVGTWVVLEESHGNRRRVALHGHVLRQVFPADARVVSRWLACPDSPLAALSFVTIARPGNARRSLGPIRRVPTTPARLGRLAGAPAERSRPPGANADR